MPVEKIFLVGHAQLPQGMAAKSMFETLAITAEFERKYGVILRVGVTLVTDEGKGYFARMLEGRSMNDSVEDVLQDIRLLYHGAAQNALIAATKDLWRHYSAWKAAQGTAQPAGRNLRKAAE